MPDITADEIITQKHKRSFIQFGGARPGNVLVYGGQDGQYAVINGVSLPETGGIDPIWVADPRQIGKFRLIGRSVSPADLPSATLVLRERHGQIPKQLSRIGCQFNMYEVTGACKDLSDFTKGWTDYVLIYSGGLVTDKDLGDRTGWDSDDPVEDSLTLTLNDIYPIGGMSFGTGASAQVDREVVDIVYANKLACPNCGPEFTGYDKIYAITKSSGAGSPGLPAELIYTLDGGATWYQSNITGIGASEDPLAVDIVGNYVVVLAGTAAIPAYYYAELNSMTGVPGTFTKITSGFVANRPAYDFFVASSREVYLVGNAGYIYKASDITAGVTVVSAGDVTAQNLRRIHGRGDVMVATGDNGAIVKSVNRGRSWILSTTTPTASVIQAICVLDNYRYWIGHNAGRVYFTLDGGESWSEKLYSWSGTGAVMDIVAPTGEVIHVAYVTTTPLGKLKTTWNGGADWVRDAPRILNWPTFDRANRLAIPDVDAPGISANNLAIAGLADDGTDGVIIIGSVAMM